MISIFANKKNSNDPSSQETINSTTNDAITLFKETFNDLQKFCDRNTETCKTGKSFLESIGKHIRHGAKIAYEYLDHTLDNKNTVQTEDTHPKSNAQNFTEK
ncbi:DUF5330 domain-containing protein [Bartonella sp. F02]|uniref:DUF5330 domain-containing protein n=1 Tax=Bartonella sp. F02 TaxID=2967262 RepID=UPI002E77DC97|nr:DUF5330 domain-containing protein [Bartonella sp. F02]